jgi:hypothetical protein
MTREHALSIIFNCYDKHGMSSVRPEVVGVLLDTLVALGVLKLDEPKTIEQRTTEIIERHATPAQSMHIVAGLKKAGLL